MQSNILHSQQPNTSEALATGRKVGILLLLQLVSALMLPFILAKPITVGSPAFLTAATDFAIQIRIAIGMTFIGSVATVWLGITACQIFQHFNRSVALVFIIVCSISAVIDLLHAASLLSLLSISEQFIRSGSSNSSVYEIAGITAASARRSTHIIQLIAIAAWMIVFYSSLFRFKLVPRILSSIGLIGIVLQFTGVTLMMLLGFSVIGEMAMPLFPIEITLGLWLIIRGFQDRPLKPVA
jgi:hypothetical protein